MITKVGECEAAKLALRDQEDRLHELLELEKSIQEMHDLFVELNLMVQCQVACALFSRFLFCLIKSCYEFRVKRLTE